MRKYLTIAAAVALGVAAAPLIHTVAAKPPLKADTYKQLELFTEAFERVRADYVEEEPDDQLVEAAINGMLTSLDPHSNYMNKKSWDDMQVQTKGEFGGLGLEVTEDNGVVKVMSPIDDTPAARAGVQPGDFITHIDGEPAIGIGLNAAVERMRGPPGSTIKLTIHRASLPQPLVLTLTRAVIKVQSVRWRAEGNVGYIRISSFNEQTQPGLDKAIAELSKQLGPKLQGYVLDLRNNPGGLLDQAISVSDTFLDKGEIVSTRGRHPEQDERYNAKPGDAAHGLPIVALINGGSASASEIVAGALQDHKRAVILGTQSFGKGSVQTLLPMPGGGAMRLTTARYYTPSGRSIQQLGITPDIEVQPAKVEEIAAPPGFARREADLPHALANPDLKNGKTAPKAPSKDGAKPDDSKQDGAKPESKADKPTDAAPATPADDGGKAPDAKTPDAKGGDPKAADKDAKPATPPQDYQLTRALDLIRGLALFNGQGRAAN